MACFQSHYSSSTLISCTGPRQTEEEGKPQDTKTWKKTPRVGKKCSPHHIPFELTINSRAGMETTVRISTPYSNHITRSLCVLWSKELNLGLCTHQAGSLQLSNTQSLGPYKTLKGGTSQRRKKRKN